VLSTKTVLTVDDRTRGAFNRVAMRAEGMAQRMNRVRGRMRVAGSRMMEDGARMRTAISLPAAGVLGGSLFITEGYERAANFVKGMAREAGATADQLEALREQSLVLGRTTMFTARQVAEAQKFLAMSGNDAERILGTTPATLRLAAAAQMDLGEAANYVTNVMKGMGLEIEEVDGVVDVLTKGFTSTNIDMRSIGEQMKHLGGNAKAMGQDLTEAVAALGLVGDAGAADIGGTGLRMVNNKFANPTTHLRKEFKRLGIEIKKSDGKLRPLADLLIEMEEKGYDPMRAGKDFGNRAANIIQLLYGKGHQLREQVKILQSADGIGQRLQDVQMEGLPGTVKKLWSAIEGLMIAIADKGGVAESFSNWADSVIKLSNALAAGDASTLRFIVKMLVITAVLSPVIITLGFLIWSISQFAVLAPVVVFAIGKIAAGMALLGRVMGLAGALASTGWMPFLAVAAVAVAAVALLGAAGYLLANNWQEITGWLIRSVGAIAKVFFSAFGLIGDLLSGDFAGAWMHLKKLVANVWGAIKTIVAGAVQGIWRGMLQLGDVMLSWLPDGMEEKVRNVLGSIANGFGSFASKVGDFLSPITKWAGGLLKDLGLIKGIVGNGGITRVVQNNAQVKAVMAQQTLAGLEGKGSGVLTEASHQQLLDILASQATAGQQGRLEVVVKPAAGATVDGIRTSGDVPRNLNLGVDKTGTE